MYGLGEGMGQIGAPKISLPLSLVTMEESEHSGRMIPSLPASAAYLEHSASVGGDGVPDSGRYSIFIFGLSCPLSSGIPFFASDFSSTRLAVRCFPHGSQRLLAALD